MQTAWLEARVGDLVVERPSRSRVLERYGIDYCCGGKQPLARACERKQVDADEVVAALEAHDQAQGAEPASWATLAPAELCDHVEATHHAWLREELPRLDALTEKVARVHGGRHPWLVELRAEFVTLRIDLEAHLVSEERDLFPKVRTGEPVELLATMEQEHELVGGALERLRTLSDGYTPPADACNTFRAMLDGLAELEADTHLHVHKENHVLFPALGA